MDAIASAPARATAKKPSPARQPVAAVEEVAKARRYSAIQYETILEKLAGRLGTLDQVLMMAQTSRDSWETSVLIDAAQAIASSLGAMADTAVGGGIIGDADHWNYGPTFKEAA